ncbi:MAG: hypothetical protein KME35_16945 [Aphanocapsa sp. GSE-SYN-MK-11-07L]|nr:hypothetical protein [Aphanocapsa sp. GSE-SYN-MK-11-07L]
MMTRRLIRYGMLLVSGAITVGCQSSSSNPSANSPTPAASPAIASQVLSANAYKVPYLGYNGTFHLNAESESSTKDTRNPKRIDIQKMEEVTFYQDTAGKTAIARDCHYAYLGAVPDAKYYPEYKTSVWDIFELEQDEEGNQDPACKQFQYLSFTAPHGDPIHMHFRYGDEKSSFQTLVSMSTAAEDSAKFNPWWSTYCGDGKTACGKD